MQPYLFTVMLLSGAAFIHGKSEAPEFRPANGAANRTWTLLGKAAFSAWLCMVVWGGFHGGPWYAVAAVIGSVAMNAVIAKRGPRAAWPGVSMLFAVAGLGLAAAMVFGRV